MKSLIGCALFIFLLAAFGCGDSTKSKLTIENEWVRNGAKGMNTAFFFDVKNEGAADTLYKAESDAAELVEIHETFEEGDMMGMRETEHVAIEANSTFNFKPRAHHVMLINLQRDLSENDEVEFTLHFRNAGEVKVKAKVKRMQ